MWVQPFKVEVEQIPQKLEAEHRVAVLLNLNARMVTKKVQRALSHALPETDLFLSRSPLDARRIAQQVVDRGYHTVFLGGGDGTLTCFLNEILNQVSARRQYRPSPTPRFGILKLGTGNSVASLLKASSARGDGMVDDVLRARAGQVPGYRTIDLLLIEGKRAPFAGLGMDGRLINDYIWLKDNFGQGRLAKVITGAGGYFTSVAFKTVPYYLTHSAAVHCDVINGASVAYRMGPDGTAVETFAPGTQLYSGPVAIATAGTVPYCGFELKMFPFAGKRRGMMNLRLGTLPATSILANLPKLWAGTWFPEGLYDFLAKDVTLRFSRPMPLQISGDGEGQRNEIHIEIARESIDLVDFTPALH